LLPYNFIDYGLLHIPFQFC